MKKLLLVLVVWLVAGCAPKLDAMYRAHESGLKQASKVYMIRNSASLYTLYPTVDDKTVAGLSNGEYVAFQLPSGRHEFRNMIPHDGQTNTFALVLFGGQWAYWAKANMTIHTLKNQEYYFLLESIAGGNPRIELLDAAKGRALVKKSTYIPTGTISGSDVTDVEVLEMPLVAD